ncbi:capsule assembly Wzi family protein, partial [Nostoc sp. CHAB 5834]|nr:capsule assembly Wzi family protein [Nostoc sp. CHAB 5834]
MPRNGTSGLIQAGTTGQFTKATHPNRGISYGIDVVGIAGKQPTVLLPQAYVSINGGWFNVWAGRKKEIIGLGDSTLTSGFYSWSGNALPITKVQVGTNGFVPLGFTKGLVSINAFFAHGWFPNTDSIQGSYLHQKAVYGRIGKPSWKVKLYGGLIHNAQWGGQSSFLGTVTSINGKLPSTVKDYLSVIIAKQPKEADVYSEFDRVNQIGNHLGSVDVGAELELARWNVLGYYQHAFEDKSGLKFVNFPDGLYGIRFKRKPIGAPASFRVNQLTIECLTTMNQSGLVLGPKLQGIDDCFNNFQYLNGWTNQRQIIGTPFLSPRSDVKQEWRDLPTGPYKPSLTVINNRVQVIHVGGAGTFRSGIQVQTKLSYSSNYGLIRNPFGQTVGQFSGSLWLT